MKHNKFYKLDDDFQIKCRPYLLYDSLLYLEIGDKKILNLNDCGVDSIRQAEYIQKITGNVDLLLTQFGYAAHIGDPEDVHLRKETSKEKLMRIKIQSQVFNAKYVIPFASFVWFSHEDNFYMNDEVNKIKNVEKFIKKQTKSIPIILYPGNKWSLNEEYDNNRAIELYENDFAIQHIPHNDSPKIHFKDLQLDSNNYITNIRNRNNWTFNKISSFNLIFKICKNIS